MVRSRSKPSNECLRWLAALESEYSKIEQLEQETEEEEEKPPLSLIECVNIVYPKYQWYKHNLKLANALQRVADGELKRLMIFAPPRHGKSLLTSKIFPAYCLYRHPDKYVAIASYAAELAYGFSRSSRDGFRLLGGTLRDDSQSVKQWETPEGGGLWAAGVGGAATGRGFGSVGIIDDPLKNAEEAASDTIKRKQEEWYSSTFYTRAENDAAIIVIQTRWAEDDLSGWLLSNESGEDPERWHVVNFQAIKEDSTPKIPSSCTLEPDWRETGEALCPERFNAKKLLKIKERIGSRFFEALYQQNPSPAEGDLFKRQWWKFYFAPPKFDQIIQSWDCTFKDTSTSDYVVGHVWGKAGSEYYLIDQVRERMDINGTLSAIQTLSAKYPEARAKLIEDKANGTAVIDLLKRKVSGLIAVNPEGGKIVRANAVAPYAEAGNIYLPEPTLKPWVHDFIEEHSAFPNGAHDDMVDCFSQAIAYLEKNTSGWFLPMASIRK